MVVSCVNCRGKKTSNFRGYDTLSDKNVTNLEFFPSRLFGFINLNLTMVLIARGSVDNLSQLLSNVIK